MMIYLQKNRSRKKSFVRTLVITLAVIVVAVLIKIFAGSTIDRMAMSVGGPVSASYSGIKTDLAFAGAFLHSRTALVSDNKKLQDDLDVANTKLLRLDSVSKENHDLLDAYGRSPFAGKSILANVIAKPPQSPYDILLVDAGTQNGVAVGDIVYAVGGIPIGHVAEITGSTAKVVMFSSDGEKSQAIHERTGATVSLVGTGGGNLEAEVAQEMDIEKGDEVVLPQFDGAIVATVVEVESTVTGATKQALFRIPMNLFYIRWVEIVKKPQ